VRSEHFRYFRGTYDPETSRTENPVSAVRSRSRPAHQFFTSFPDTLQDPGPDDRQCAEFRQWLFTWPTPLLLRGEHAVDRGLEGRVGLRARAADHLHLRISVDRSRGRRSASLRSGALPRKVGADPHGVLVLSRHRWNAGTSSRPLRVAGQVTTARLAWLAKSWWCISQYLPWSRPQWVASAALKPGMDRLQGKVAARRTELAGLDVLALELGHRLPDVARAERSLIVGESDENQLRLRGADAREVARVKTRFSGSVGAAA